MNTASAQAYVSKRKLQRYQEERQKVLQKLAQGLSIEEATKFEDEQPKQQQVEESKTGDEQSQQKRRVSLGRTDQFVRERNLSECDVASDDEVHSQELGDDIGQTITYIPKVEEVKDKQPQQQAETPADLATQTTSQTNQDLTVAGKQPQQQTQQNMVQQQVLPPPQMQVKKQINKVQKIQQPPKMQQLPDEKPEKKKKKNIFKRFIGLFKSKSKKMEEEEDQKQFEEESPINSFEDADEFINNRGMMQQLPNNFRMQQNGLYSDDEDDYSNLKIDPAKITNEKLRQKVDTNVFQVSMSCLKNSNNEIATGDIIECKSCKGILNMFSVVTIENNNQLWVCEFCNHKNYIDIDPNEQPKTSTVTYILQSAPQVKSKEEMTKLGTTGGAAEDISIVYCIDISGSMSGERLNAVKETILSQIQDMVKNHPKRKVGLVTFSDDVDIIGDGTVKKDLVVSGQCGDYKFLLKNSTTGASNMLSQPISKTYESLKSKVQAMHTTGGTDLPPGLISSVGLASLGTLGSQVIICTDGQSDGELNSEQYYKQIGEYAKEKGVTIHIVTFTGTECDIDKISIVCQLTNGDIERVDVRQLGNNVKQLLSRNVIATNVKLKVKLHAGIEFRNELLKNLEMNETVLTKDFGNVNDETDLCFEYQIKPLRELLKLTEVDFSQISKLPFQAQISFTAMDGSRQVRVITQFLQVSTDKEELRKKANFDILCVNAIQQSSKMAREGDYKRAQAFAKVQYNNLNRDADKMTKEQKSQMNAFTQNINPTYKMLHQQVNSSKVTRSNKTKVNDMMSQNFYMQNRCNVNQFQSQY